MSNYFTDDTCRVKVETIHLVDILLSMYLSAKMKMISLLYFNAFYK